MTTQELEALVFSYDACRADQQRRSATIQQTIRAAKNLGDYDTCTVRVGEYSVRVDSAGIYVQKLETLE